MLSVRVYLYPSMTSWCPLVSFLYAGMDSSVSMVAAAVLRSLCISNSGTTRSGRPTPASFCSSATLSTSLGLCAMLMTYAPRNSSPTSKIILNVASTSFTSSVAK